MAASKKEKLSPSNDPILRRYRDRLDAAQQFTPDKSLASVVAAVLTVADVIALRYDLPSEDPAE